MKSFKEFISKKKKRLKRVRSNAPSNMNPENYTGKCNYVNTPSSLPSNSMVTGDFEGKFPGYPSV